MKTRPISDLRREPPSEPPYKAELRLRGEHFDDLIKYLQGQVSGTTRFCEGRCRFILPLPPNILNASWLSMWWARREFKSQFESHCRALQMARLIPLPPLVPFPQVLVGLTFYTVKEHDIDNLASRQKYLLDWLKGRYFVDDAPSCLQIEPLVQARCKPDPPRVEVELQVLEAPV